jgi:hypothetical protein
LEQRGNVGTAQFLQLIRSDGRLAANRRVMDDNVLDFYIRQLPAPANRKPSRIRGC